MISPLRVLVGLVLTASPLAAQQPNPPAESRATIVVGTSIGERAARAIAEAERQFARMGKEKGIRDSFLAYFAPDGLAFEPAPTAVAQEYPKQPNPPLTLLWEPEEVGASADGMIGFSTGPYLLRANDALADKPPVHGRFLSIWKHQPDGTWKVLADFGCPGGPRAELPLAQPGGETLRFTGFATPRPDQSRRELPATRDAFFRALEKGDWKALRSTLHENFRAGWDAAGFQPGARIPDEAWASLAPRGCRFDVTHEAVAESGDFAWAHGKVSREGAIAGYWLGIWLRDAATDRWEMIRLVRNEAPKS